MQALGPDSLAKVLAVLRQRPAPLLRRMFGLFTPIVDSAASPIMWRPQHDPSPYPPGMRNQPRLDESTHHPSHANAKFRCKYYVQMPINTNQS